MKVEGMPYPLQVKPIGAKNNHRDEKDLSDDAVYFEPEERRDKKQNPQQESNEEPEKSEAPLELQVTKEVAPAIEKKSGEHSPLDITV